MAMAAAATSSIPNLFSFFTPSPPLKSPPSYLSTVTPYSGTKTRWAPLTASNISSNELGPPPTCSGYNVQVIVDDDEPEEKLLGRFRREVMRAGVIQECRRRRFFENKQEEKKRKTREAAKRNRRRRPFQRILPQQRPEETKSKKADDEDNWDLPEGTLPY